MTFYEGWEVINTVQSVQRTDFKNGVMKTLSVIA